MASIITSSGFEKIRTAFTSSSTLDINKMVFCYYPSANVEGTPEATLTYAALSDYQVHEQALTKIVQVGADQVQYTTAMGASIGDFEYNFVGIVDTTNTLIACGYQVTENKYASSANNAGNSVVKIFSLKLANVAIIANFSIIEGSGDSEGLVALDSRITALEKRPTRGIFDIWYSLSSEVPHGAMPLDGRLIYNCDTVYPDFYQECIKRKSAKTIRTITENAWQSEATNNKGSCGAFVIDETRKSVRLPKIIDYLRPAKTAGELGIFNHDEVLSHRHSEVGNSIAPTGTGYTAYSANANSFTGYTGGDENLVRTVKLSLFIQVFHGYINEANADIAAALNTINNKVDRANFCHYESLWFDIMPSKSYAEELINEPIYSVPIEKRTIKLLLKCKTAVNGYEVGDIIDFSNTNSRISADAEIGCVAFFRGSKIIVAHGNATSIIYAKAGGGFGGSARSNFQMKIIIEGWAL